jgi:nucleotide-binding universal stress UspA family protein
MNKIVIGLVDSEQGHDALALGAQMAQKLGAHPIVVCALPYSPDVLGSEQLERALEHDTEGLFALAREQLDGLDPEVRAAADRSPARSLYQVAAAEDAVAIVVGSTHRGALGHVLPGSVGANLLAGAPCAVAVAPRGYAARDDRRLLRIGIAFDGSAESWAALETGIGLARRLRAGLVLITAIAPPGYGYGEALSVLSAEEIHTARQAEARRVLDLGLARVPAEVTADPRLINGEPGAALADAAADVGLLVLGSRRYGPLRRTLLGSVSTAVIRRAPCPVLVLPRGAGVDPLRLDAAAAAASEAAG